jgi:P27 family predicted phage terminase small subunit
MSARIPDSLHALKGTRATRAAERVAFQGCRPRMPKTLSPEEQISYKEIVKLLSKRRTITAEDVLSLKLWAQTDVRHQNLLKELRDHGEMIDQPMMDSNGGVHTKRILNPAGKTCTQLGNNLKALLQQFGLTPASREKAPPTAPPPPKGPVEGSFMWGEEVLARRRAEQQQAASEEEPAEPALPLEDGELLTANLDPDNFYVEEN